MEFLPRTTYQPPSSPCRQSSLDCPPLPLLNCTGICWDNIPSQAISGRPQPAADISRPLGDDAEQEFNAIISPVNKQSKDTNETAQSALIPDPPSAHEVPSSFCTAFTSSTIKPSSPPQNAMITSRSKRQPAMASTFLLPPVTITEWKTTLDEIKTLLSRKHFKQCSIKSKQILNSIRDQFDIHPLYLIFLYFYTASSLEQTARSLHNSSSRKLPLVEEALSYYQKAQSQIEHASFTANPKAVRLPVRQNYSPKSSIASSKRSSMESIFSNASATSIYSAPSSPSYDAVRSSKDSDHCTSPSRSKMKPAALRIKKVSFCDEHTMSLTESNEISYRPAKSELLEKFPSPPPSSPSPVWRSEQYLDQYTTTSFEQLQNLALTRYQTHLTAFSAQAAYHISSVQEQLHILTQVVNRKNCQSSNLADFTESNNGGLRLHIDGVDQEEQRKVELQERIRRLKEAGWKRKRFSPKKYQTLCEKAICEVDGLH